VPRFSLPFRLFALLLLGIAGLWLGGCTESERFSYATEADEPNYREGVALLKTGRKQEALTAFLKVIDKRGEDAPESHLEVGLLYLQHINDPLSAIYHFRKFLALRPNSQQAALVKQRIDAATRDFARTLPAQPIENRLQRVDLVATLDRLKQENESLKQELADLRSNRPPSAPPAASSRVQPVAADPEPEPTPAAAEESADATTPTVSAEDFNFSLSSMPTVRTRRPPANTASLPTVRTQPEPVAPAPKQAASTPAQKNAAPAAANPAANPAGGRRHTVRPGETLSQISLQYYGNRSRWRDIYAANRGVMRSETDLKVGMVIKIP
jgi:tetratricopeptide (TPR) repeat protein